MEDESFGGVKTRCKYCGAEGKNGADWCGSNSCLIAARINKRNEWVEIQRRYIENNKKK